jgi:hypothetical protein
LLRRRFDAVVGSNLLMDILIEVGAVVQGASDANARTMVVVEAIVEALDEASERDRALGR